MSLSGSLSTMQLGDLLQWCETNRKTGTLSISRGAIEKELYFKNGRLFSSRSSSPRETLGQFLIRSGHLSEEELFKALIQQDHSKRPLGQVLLANDAITESELEELLKLKTEESIYDCFLWSAGEFLFEEGVLPEAIPFSLPLDMTGVILEGARRSDEWRRIHKVFRSRLTTFTLDPGSMESGAALTEEEQRLLDLVGRGMNLAEIALELHAVEFYAASLLLQLYERRLLRVKESPEEIDVEVQVSELRAQLEDGVNRYNRGDYDAALTAFEGALDVDPHNKYARLFTLKIHRLLDDRKRVASVPLDGVPRVKGSIEDLSRHALDPQEGFVLSRVNGEWDIASITKICPMGEQDVRVIFKRLLDEGLIEIESA